MFLCALSSVAITLGIVGILLFESWNFFKHVSLFDFLTDTQWTVLFENPRYGIMPLVTGTVVTSSVALFVALPLGTTIAIYLSEYANNRVREILKPILELLSAVPTVVFGYFALLFVTPLLQQVLPILPGFNMLSAGSSSAFMIIPYVSSLSEDAMRRSGSYTRGLTPWAQPLPDGCPRPLPCCILRHRFGLCFGISGRRRNDGGGHRRRWQPN